jgi:hypothetical protein
MKEIATLPVIDVDGDEAVAIVRSDSEHVWLTLSARHGADVEVCLRPEQCDALIAALQQAARLARR